MAREIRRAGLWVWIPTWVKVVFGILVFVGLAYKVLFPAELSITTRHKIEYLPANYLVVSKVTNFFSHNQGLTGGAGGIGLPQVELSLSQYQARHGKELQYLTFTPRAGRETANLEYFDIQPSLVLHTSQSFDDPWFYALGVVPVGYWLAESASVEGLEIFIQRSYILSGDFLLMIILVLFLVGMTSPIWGRLFFR